MRGEEGLRGTYRPDRPPEAGEAISGTPSLVRTTRSRDPLARTELREVAGHGLGRGGVQFGGRGESRPLRDGVSDLTHDPTVAGDLLAGADRVQVVVGDPLQPSVHRKVVAARPLAVAAIGVGDVESGRDGPLPAGAQQEREVLRVVVAVDGQHVEDHAAVGLT